MSSVSPIAMARLAAMKKPEQPAGTSTWTYDARAMIEANDTDLRALGISTGKVKSMPDGGQLWELTGCPYSQDHDDGAFRVQYADGGIHVGCHHARCQGKTIKVEPTLFRRTLEVTGTPGISTTPLQGGNGQHAAGGSPRSEAETPERMPWVVSLADVEAKPIEWIWPNWLAQSMLTILGGHGGDGKSTLTMDLIARLSKGGILPDGKRAPKLNTLLLAAEDDPQYAIKPRLHLHGADMNRVAILKGITGTDGKAEWFNIRKDVEMMREVIHARGIGFVVIDPLSAYMPKADRNSEGDVRDALMPLQTLMESTGVAVLGIMHVGKGDAQRRTAQRLLGSTAFTALARCVWMVHDLPEEHQPEPQPDIITIGKRKVMGVVKANYSLKPPALAWSQPQDGPIRWHGESPVSIDAAFEADAKQAAPKRSEAEAFLLDYLKSGSKYATQMYKDAEREGISGGTLRLALKAINAESYKDSGPGGQWLWKLPTASPDTTEVAKVAKVAKGANTGNIRATSSETSPNGLSRDQLDSSNTFSNMSNFSDLPDDDSEPNAPTGTDGEVKM